MPTLKPQQLIKITPKKVAANGLPVSVQYVFNYAQFYQRKNDLLLFLSSALNNKVVLVSVTEQNLIAEMDIPCKPLISCHLSHNEANLEFDLFFKGMPLHIWHPKNKNMQSLQQYHPLLMCSVDNEKHNGYFFVNTRNQFIYLGTRNIQISFQNKLPCDSALLKSMHYIESLEQIIFTTGNKLYFYDIVTQIFSSLDFHCKKSIKYCNIIQTNADSKTLLITLYHDVTNLMLWNTKNMRMPQLIEHKANIRCCVTAIVGGKNIIFTATEDQYLHYWYDDGKPVGKSWRLPAVAIHLFCVEKKLYIVLEDGSVIDMLYQRIPFQKTVHTEQTKAITLLG